MIPALRQHGMKTNIYDICIAKTTLKPVPWLLASLFQYVETFALVNTKQWLC